MKTSFVFPKHLGANLTIIGTALILFWIGLFKFTPTEAKAIQSLVNNSPLTSWMTPLLGIQLTSNLIGAVEVLVALLLIGVFIPQKSFQYLAVLGGAIGTLTFLVTLSFLATTPGAFSVHDGFIIPDSFILKDLVLLGACLMCITKAQQTLTQHSLSENLLA